MSEPSAHANGESSDLERITTPHPVDPTRIERELAAVWREASDGEIAVTRACAGNVVFAPDPGLAPLASVLPRYLAARALVLRDAPAGSAPLTSWISANCILAPHGGKLVCSEEVSLQATTEGRRHIPALIRALLVPGVPVGVVFSGCPGSDPLTEGLLELADRVVIHMSEDAGTHGFRMGQRLEDGQSLADRAWFSQAELRSAVASAFDEDPEASGRVQAVEARSPPSLRGESALALGWVADRLGTRSIDEGLARHRGGETRLGWQEGEDGLLLRFTGEDGARRDIHRRSDGSIHVETPRGVDRQRRHASEPAGLLARALLGQSADEGYGRAAHWAEVLT